jgi:transitional endoplasmic reticulum ATPase
MEPLKLKVAEAIPKDAGRAYARIDPADMRRLGLEVGDIVQVQGKQQSVAKLMPNYPEMRGQGLVQLDGLTRTNAGLSIDDRALLEPIAIRPATRVVLSPRTIIPGDRDLAYIGSLLDGLPVVKGDMLRARLFGSRSAEFLVDEVAPVGAVTINPTTLLMVGKSRTNTNAPQRLSYEDVGGLGGQVQRIREMIELPLRYPEVFERLGIDPPKGVLLNGPPGCGKTLIARIIAQETDAQFYSISGPEVVHKFYGESEAHLRKIFDEASSKGPSIIFLDEIDAIAPRRDKVTGDVEKRIVAQLLALMDGLKRRQNVIVIAATNLPNALDPALRRPGRFDREITIPVPDREGRREIFEIHSCGMPLGEDVDLSRLADVTHGFVGADIEALCREAAMQALRRLLPDIDFSQAALPYDRLLALSVTMDDFQVALREVMPSAIREVFVDIPDVRWEDVGGLKEVRRRLVEAVEWPIKYPELYKQVGVRPPKGLLLAGAPGIGKTLIAKAVANESGVNVISVKGPALMSRFVGDSEQHVRELFQKARQAAPCIIFLDEVDALIPARGESATDSHVSERVLSQFLAEMDGMEELKGVFVLGATNRVDLIDPAMLRPGRFDEVLELPLPDEAARQEILTIHLKNKPVGADINVADLAARTEGASGSDLAAICNRAALRALRRFVESSDAIPTPDIRVSVSVEAEDFEWALNEIMQA